MKSITIAGDVSSAKSTQYIKQIADEKHDRVVFEDTKFESEEFLRDFFKNLPGIEHFRITISEQELDLNFLKNVFDHMFIWSTNSLCLSLCSELPNEILTEYVTKLKLEKLEIYLDKNSSTHKLINYPSEIIHLSVEVPTIDRELLDNLISHTTNKIIKSLELRIKTFNVSPEDLMILRALKLKSFSLVGLNEFNLDPFLVVSLFENLPYTLEKLVLHNAEGKIKNSQLLQFISERPSLKKLICPQLGITNSQIAIHEDDSPEMKEFMKEMLVFLDGEKQKHPINLSHLSLGVSAPEALKEFISPCNALESIHLINARFSELPIANPEKLKKISLHEIPIDEAFYSHLKQCTCLEKLEILEGNFGNSEAALIANLFDLPALKTLSIIFSSLQIEHAINIAKNLAKTQLEDITIIASELTLEGVLEILKAAADHESLKFLSLEDNGVEALDNDLYNENINEQILSIIRKSRLEGLSLDENRIQLTREFREKILTALDTNTTITKLFITRDGPTLEQINKLLDRNKQFKIASRFYATKVVLEGKRGRDSFFQDSINGNDNDEPGAKAPKYY